MKINLDNLLLQDKPVIRFWSILGLFILPISFIKIYDIDIWWHMQLGKSILENMGWPDFSTFYFTPVTQSTGNLRFTFLGDITLYIIHLVAGDVGLQMLRLFAVVICCWFLHQTAGEKKYGSWHLLLLMLLVLGTYQKQLMRNSLFAMIYTPWMLWIWWQVKYRKRESFLWLYPPVLGLWGCMHGSYLLGFGVLLLLFLGDVLDSFRGIASVNKQLIVKYLLVLAVSFTVIAVNNPQTTSYFNFQKLTTLFSTPHSSEDINGASETAPRLHHETDPSPEFNLKTFLNNTLFKPDRTLVNSADFISPFDKLDRVYVWVSLAFGALSVLFLLIFVRPVRISLALPLILSVFFGYGYLRLVGYIPIIATGVLFMAVRYEGMTRAAGFFARFTFKDRFILVPLVLCLGAYLNLFMGYPVLPGSALHAFGFGRIPSFSERLTDKVLAEYREQPVFNTLSNGGYLLYRWFPEKKVFIDGFFAPHQREAFDVLKKIRFTESSPDLLEERYGINLALIDYAEGTMLKAFVYSANWYPLYMDEGQILFKRCATDSESIAVPEVLIRSDEAWKIPEFFRGRFAQILYVIPNMLVKRGRLKDSQLFYQNNAVLLSEMAQYVPVAYINETKTLFSNFSEAYGVINSQVIRDEYEFTDALLNQQTEKALGYGQKVLNGNPHRYPVIYNMAAIYASGGDLNQSSNLLKQLLTAKDKDPAYWNSKKTHISKLYLTLFQLEKRQNLDPLAAYTYARQSHLIDPTFLTRERLYQAGIALATELTKNGKYRKAYALMKTMEVDFTDSGRMLNEIAWHILSYPQVDTGGIMKAKAYAERAVQKMKSDKDPWLDLAYDTLAEAFFRLSDFKRMRKYEALTIEAAPLERKKSYHHRELEKAGT